MTEVKWNARIVTRSTGDHEIEVGTTTRHTIVDALDGVFADYTTRGLDLDDVSELVIKRNGSAPRILIIELGQSQGKRPTARELISHDVVVVGGSLIKNTYGRAGYLLTSAVLEDLRNGDIRPISTDRGGAPRR